MFELCSLADARFEHRLQPIELIDVPLLAAGDASGEGFELRRAAAVHAGHSTRALHSSRGQRSPHNRYASLGRR